MVVFMVVFIGAYGRLVCSLSMSISYIQRYFIGFIVSLSC